MPYYGVHVPDPTQQRVFESWDAAREYITTVGSPLYKKFSVRRDAEYFAQTGKRPPLPPQTTYKDWLVMYTDGSSRDGRQSGAGVFVAEGSPLNISQPLSAPHTNNRAELMAMVLALRRATRLLRGVPLKHDITHILLVSDSKYAIQCLTTWRDSWQRNGMRTASGGVVGNADILVQLWDAYDHCPVPVDTSWVKGHEGGTGNERADALARAAMTTTSPSDPQQ